MSEERFLSETRLCPNLSGHLAGVFPPEDRTTDWGIFRSFMSFFKGLLLLIQVKKIVENEVMDSQPSKIPLNFLKKLIFLMFSAIF